MCEVRGHRGSSSDKQPQFKSQILFRCATLDKLLHFSCLIALLLGFSGIKGASKS